jgi:ATP-dependent 26S proteasome regulatory subunit
MSQTIESHQPVLADYIQSSYPCIFLRTVQPQVAEKNIIEALEELEMKSIDIGIWKATTGFMVKRADAGKNEDGRKVCDDLTDAILHVSERGSDNPIIGVFHNLRKLLDHYQNIQCIIDASMSARSSGSCIILVGPHLDLPPELKNIVTILEIPLPTQDQIVEQYTKLVRAYEKEISLPKNKNERKDLIIDAARAAIGLDELGAESAMALSMATAESIDIKVIQAQKEQEVKKSDVLEFFPVDGGIEDVGGFDYFKEWLTRRSRAFSKDAREYGLPYPKGMLIVGPAGTGKSLTAKATAAFLKLPLLRLDMGKVFRSLVGESEAAIRMALQVAEAVSPVVLWIDEVEKGMAGMRGSGELDSGVTGRVVSTVLTWRQETKYPVMLVATANDVASLPAMVYRKGRLDEVWATDLPEEHERAEIFGIHIRKRDRDPDDYNLTLLAQRTEEFTGAEIEGCIEDAMFLAFENDVEFETKHIIKSINETVPQALRDAEELNAIREWVASRARGVSSGSAPKKEGSKVRKLHTKKKR